MSLAGQARRDGATSRRSDSVVFGREAREELLLGIDRVARLARLTMGPRGRNVAMQHRDYAIPRIVNRAHFLIEDLELPSAVPNVGAKLLRQVAAQTGELVGDGTTTATLLCHAIIVAGAKVIAAGANPMILKRGIEQATSAVTAYVQSLARPLANNSEVGAFATAWSGSETIGAAIVQALDRIGEDGLIELERSPRDTPLELEFVEGVTLPQGYLSPFFLQGEAGTNIELIEPCVLLTDWELTDQDDLLPVFEQLVTREHAALLVVAADVSGSALSLLTANNTGGKIRCVAVRAPDVNEYRSALLDDLAVWTGGRSISKATGALPRFASLGDLGRARLAHVGANETTIIDGKGEPTAVRRRVEALKAETRAGVDDYRRDKLSRRVAQLTGGVAIIRYGGATDAERNERRLRLEDAVAGMWAAMRGGVVPGSGAALLAASWHLDDLHLSGDEAIGANIVRDALAAPLRQLVRNAGGEDGVVVSDLVRLQGVLGVANVGYDVARGAYCDPVVRGIMDPTEVVCTELEVAASSAAMILTTEAVVLEPRPQRPTAPQQASDGNRGRGGESL